MSMMRAVAAWAAVLLLVAHSPQTAGAPAAGTKPGVSWFKPFDRTQGVPVRPVLALGFATPMNPSTLNATTVTLLGAAGVVNATITVAPDARSVRVRPVNDLTPASDYTLFVRGAEDASGNALSLAAIGFRTSALKAGSHGPQLPGVAQAPRRSSTPIPAGVADAETWTPESRQSQAAWTFTGSPSYDRTANSGWMRDVQPLKANANVTAISGYVLRINGRPLADASVSVGAIQSKTDEQGRFLLAGLQPGAQVLTIDASRPGPGNANFGVYQLRVVAVPGQTTVMPEPFWLNKLDPRGTVSLPSPTLKETVVQSPSIPGLELRIPAGTVIRDWHGSIVAQINITPIPVDRPPFPLPGFDVPVYFTIQPGGAWIQGVASGAARGVRLIYPNSARELSGARSSFWNYDPQEKEWYIYGLGSVTADRRQVAPDPEVVIYQFSGAMINSAGLTPPGVGPAPGCGTGGSGPTPNTSPGGGGGGTPPSGDGGTPSNGDPPPKKPNPRSESDCDTAVSDPVDSATGLFVHENSDLFLPDTWSLDLVRTYRQGDASSRPFGVGMTHPFEMFLWSANQYQQADLVLPSGGRVHYVRTSPGTGFTDAEFESTSSPGRFHKSTLKWNGNGWDLRLKDGTVYVYGDTTPLQSMRDRFGNTVRFTRTSKSARGTFGNITQLTSPNGRFIQFTYDASNRITSAKDNLGRTVAYSYDTYGRLSTITNPAGGVTTYGWGACTGAQASCTWLETITDARGAVRLTNSYDSNGRVQQQTLAGGATYGFAYTTSGTTVTQTDITNPRGDVTRKAFANGYVASTVRALGKPEQRTTSIARDPNTNQIASTTDQLGRVTTYGRDALGNVTSITLLSSTPQANTTTFTFDPQFSLLSSVVDPLGHTTTFTYDTKGNMLAVTDALSHQTTMTYTDSGQLKTSTDPLGHTTTFTYQGGDLVGITDALGRTTTRFADAIGRVSTVKDAAGNKSSSKYDVVNRRTQITDPLGYTASFGYDANGNLASFTDARGGSINWVYDSLNRAATRTDALGQSETYAYDSAGNITRKTDRKGQVTGYTYDFLNRPVSIGFGATVSNPTAFTSTIVYTYDGGDRITQIDDSLNGIITRAYDGLDRLVLESTPEGTVTYTFDAASRRTEMTASGQATTTYSFDAADRLTSITRGTQTVTFGYDHADRRTSWALPGGVSATYSYDVANQLTAISYASGTTPVGDLTYEYDLAGRRINQGGAFARINLPSGISGATYDAGNRLTNWDGYTVAHDLNGNMTSALGDTLAWNARDQLTGSSGTTAATFAYDGLGRRRSVELSGSLRRFLYDGIQPIQERDATNGLVSTLLTGDLDEIFVRSTTSGDQVFLTDALGSAVRLVDGSGVKLVDYTYEPYGQSTADNSAVTNTFQFTGREKDGVLQYNRARYYDPRIGRFIAEDPIGIAGGLNLFSYVGGNPLSFTDPLGLQPKDPIRNAMDLIPLEGGGGGGFGGTTVGGRSPFGGAKVSANRCPPEVKGTLDRINAGERFPHRNDGSVFHNREGLLPAKPDGYYREWVHPTPGVQGPGAQRVVTGQGGEAYYSPDHYRTFIPVPK